MAWDLGASGWTPVAPPSGYILLASRIFQGATVGDLGRAAAGKSITFPGGAAETWTLVNGTANFLAADPSGCYVDASGVNLKSGSSACSDDWGDGNILGPCLYKLVSEIVPATLWSGTTLGLSSLYECIDLIWIVDGSSANTGNEALACGYGATTAFGNGAAGRVGSNNNPAAGSTIQRSTFNANIVASSTFSFPGSAVPTAIRVRICVPGATIAFGVASGLTPPSTWYSRDALYAVASDNTPNGAGGHLNTAMVAAIGLLDSNGGGNVIGTVKALYIFGQKLQTGQTLTVAA